MLYDAAIDVGLGSDLRVVASTTNGQVTATAGLVVARFWRQLRIAEVEAMRRGFDTACDGASRIGLFIMLDDDTASPPREIRDALGEVLAEHAARLVGWSACVRGSDVDATSKRTLMKLLMAFARIRCPWVVEDAPVLAGVWLAEQIERELGRTCDVDRWVQVLGDARPDPGDAEA